MAQLIQITDNVHLAHGPAVNWVLVTDDSGVMLIDAGYPGDREEVLTSLRRLGFGPSDLRAILLTHAHIDHLGTAIWLAREHGVPVYCHADEVAHAKREYLEQVKISDLALRLWRPRWAVWTAHVMRSGGLIRDGIPTAQPLTADIAAGLPGNPKPVFSPGHTNGHCSYLVDGVLASGDALVTGHPLIPDDGPQLLPAIFSYSQETCIRTLSALAQVDTEILAPGHGPLWRGPIREATDAALRKAR
ncbi:MBL fold metallo-hydrolase [Mycobacterium asiaticum]|uniref:MBL fold metallo-hydrolase n=1 Tax=Mycobacterium asiaticum TaxID=1790 RepID=A0A1A3N9G9_MYCAS|nr:MBL fold metallo-hydrolase [Mycobacterium asiaticum]OBK17709.1 MBL fold metallo-hydrolase [Mycobacterium asiaticum]